MEEKIRKAFEFANFMATLNSQKRILKEEYQQKLVFYENGGTFTASKEFINFLKVLLDLGHVQNVVVIDDNNTPILISDLKVFFDNILSCYYEAVNEYYTKYNLLTKKRTIENLVDLDD